MPSSYPLSVSGQSTGAEDMRTVNRETVMEAARLLGFDPTQVTKIVIEPLKVTAYSREGSTVAEVVI